MAQKQVAAHVSQGSPAGAAAGAGALRSPAGSLMTGAPAAVAVLQALQQGEVSTCYHARVVRGVQLLYSGCPEDTLGITSENCQFTL